MTAGIGVRRVVPLTLGWEDLPKSVSVEGAAPESFVVDPAGNILSSGTDGLFWGGEAKGDRLLVHGDRKFTYDDRGNRIREVRAAGGAVQVDYRQRSGVRA